MGEQGEYKGKFCIKRGMGIHGSTGRAISKMVPVQPQIKTNFIPTPLAYERVMGA